MAQLTEDGAARLLRLSAPRRADGSRAIRARRAWRRLVRACAEGDAATQEAVRAAELPDTDVLELLAVGPEEPADRAAYLTLIGQREQRQALDADGALLALAYWAAGPEARERLRAAMAAEGDGDAVRAVVTGEQRDRVAGMSRADLDYLGRQLAEHGRFDELRRLTLDLPPAEAVAAARLLPPRERSGETAALLTVLAEWPPEQLRATIARLPREEVALYEVEGSHLQASFSPDSSELAACWLTRTRKAEIQVRTFRIGTGEVTREHRARAFLKYGGFYNSVLHLGDAVLLREESRSRHRISRVVPDSVVLGEGYGISEMRRSSTGAVMVFDEGLAFAERDASELRHVPVPRFSRTLWHDPDAWSALATLPSHGLVAFIEVDTLWVMSESGKGLRRISAKRADNEKAPALSFLSPRSLALHRYRGFGKDGEQPITVWELPAEDPRQPTVEPQAAIRDRWALERRHGIPLDDSFAARILTSAREYRPYAGCYIDIPWLRDPADPARPRLEAGNQFAMATGGDMFVAGEQRYIHSPRNLEVHSPHLPSARGLLERPLVRGEPQHLRLAQELRPKIGDARVRDALGLLARCLEERFAGDVALGTSSVAAGGPHDIALGEDRAK
ncbi:hypothetical protein [Streptomyces lanatus]|uniref:HEAT repeat domain-containing protein n=1 Tax=Streptomyces lanatus TaxID=66900 RepID=A0ABV1XLT1_9ACTN|nr:hypothetical protein [Streptomyces lanatus]GHG98832.1 hypothetical protein GCM10018780_24950 [Streptomyces lanatus]